MLVLRASSTLPDPRSGNARRHTLPDPLTIALSATICGAERCVDSADVGRDREALFREFLDLPGGLPGHDTCSRLFRLLDPAACAGCFAAGLDDLGADGPGVAAIDGRTLRRLCDAAAARSALHVVTAFAAAARVAAGDKQSEFLAARQRLGLLDLDGAPATGDAMHGRAATARRIEARGGQRLFAPKHNRPAQHAEIAAWCADPRSRPDSEHVTTDADHGRIEVRRHRVSHDLGWLLASRRYPGEAAMPGLATLAEVEATVTRRLHLSSARLDATAFAAAVRAHWRIENSRHGVLDVGFDEDRARTRKDHGPENLAILRKLALSVRRAARPDISIRRRRKRAGRSNDFARSVIGHIREPRGGAARR